jgi:hypothetical protein
MPKEKETGAMPKVRRREAMKLKLDEDGHVVLDNGMPVYVYEDGQEIPFDAPASQLKITELNTESKNHRLEAKEANEKLATFEGIEDPAAAMKAIETVSNLDAKKLIDADQVEILKKQLGETYESERQKLVDGFTDKELGYTSQITDLNETMHQMVVMDRFSRSPYFAGENPKTTLTPDIAANHFGKHFKVEGSGVDAKVVGYLNDDIIQSREKFGTPADFEESIGTIIDNYQFKDRILTSGKAGGPESKGNQESSTGQMVFDKTDQAGISGNLEAIAAGTATITM